MLLALICYIKLNIIYIYNLKLIKDFNYWKTITANLCIQYSRAAFFNVLSIISLIDKLYCDVGRASLF